VIDSASLSAFLRAFLRAGALASLAACQKNEPPPRPLPAPTLASAPVHDASPPPDPEAAAEPAVPDAGPSQEGEWIVAGSYKFRLEGLRRCGAAAASGGPDAAAPAAPPRTWVGALVDVAARADPLLVSARDITLEKGGIILQAIFVNPPTLSGCIPGLPVKQLRAAESTRGFALFDVPEAFRRNGSGPFILAYHPTRWGGAKRAEIKIPPCLDACGERERPETAPAPPPKRRKKS